MMVQKSGLTDSIQILSLREKNHLSGVLVWREVRLAWVSQSLGKAGRQDRLVIPQACILQLELSLAWQVGSGRSRSVRGAMGVTWRIQNLVEKGGMVIFLLFWDSFSHIYFYLTPTYHVGKMFTSSTRHL